MSTRSIYKTVEEMNTFNNQSTTKHIHSSTLTKLSEKTTLMPSTSSVQSNQIFLINNVEGQPMSGILLPSNHFMVKLNQNQSQLESDTDDYIERESTSKYFSMNKIEKKMFRETFFCTLLDFMHQIVKDGRIVSSSDPIWDRVALKLDNILKPKSIYNRFVLNKHSCRTRLIEAYLKDPNSQTTDTSVLNHMMKTDMHHEVVEKRPGHVDNDTFYDALFMFRDKVLKNGEVAPSVDSVWNHISAYLNYALKPNSIYLRFKRNTHNCHKKLLAHCKLDPSKAKTYDVPNRKFVPSIDKSINKIKKKSLKFEDSSKFFKALYTHRHSIIQNGSIAKYNNSVWNEVAKMLDHVLQPSDVHSKFIRNHDLCQTKLIEACKEDDNFTPLVVPKVNKPNCVSDETFFSVLCKYREDILLNGSEIAKFSHPVWTQISRDLNDTLKPATVYFRVTRNSQLCLNRLLKPAALLVDNTINKDKFFEIISLYKYSIMNGDQVVDLNDPVWNEMSLRFNSSLTPEAIYEAISQDKDSCKTKMIQALKTERSVFSGESPEISDNMTELAPIVECKVFNEPFENFIEVLNEFKDSILQPNGQIAEEDDPVWKLISSRLKNLTSNEVYSRIINNYNNCQTLLFGVDSVDTAYENKLFEAIFSYRHLVLNNNSIAHINNEVWTKISEKINHSLTPMEIYIRFIKDIDGCRTELLKSSKKNDLTRYRGIDKDKFLDVLINHKNSILKNGSHAKPSDPIWREIASKLNFLVKPLTLYNNFMYNRHNCQQILLEACEQDKKEVVTSPISSNITFQMDHDYSKGEVDTSFEDIVSMRQKVGYVQENDFIEACFMFKDRLLKNNCIVPSTDKVWNDISKHLNYAIKAKTAYLRFKRNTHNWQEKLFPSFQVNTFSYEDDKPSSVEDQNIENEMFFDAISIFKHSIINNGIFATESNPVWLDVSNLMNNLLTPNEAFWKFRQNIDLCRTKLIKKCITDWSHEPTSVIKNRIHVINSNESLWKESLKTEQIARMNENNCQKPEVNDDNLFYDAIYKYKNDVFRNDLIANCGSPVWTAIANELNNEMEPSNIYFKFTNNMTRSNLKFSEAAQRHNFYKLKQNQNQIQTQSPIEIYDSSDQDLMVDYENEEIVEFDLEKCDIKNCRLNNQTSTME